jgi:hypothetical protein
MGFSTASLARTALVVAALAGASAASAEPIRILNAGASPRAATPASDCAAAAPEAGADIECVLSLNPPQKGAEPAAPSRILIRAQWTPARCAPRAAQVVDMAGPPARARRLPTVDQAGSGRACAS